MLQFWETESQRLPEQVWVDQTYGKVRGKTEEY